MPSVEINTASDKSAMGEKYLGQDFDCHTMNIPCTYFDQCYNVKYEMCQIITHSFLFHLRMYMLLTKAMEQESAYKDLENAIPQA